MQSLEHQAKNLSELVSVFKWVEVSVRSPPWPCAPPKSEASMAYF